MQEDASVMQQRLTSQQLEAEKQFLEAVEVSISTELQKYTYIIKNMFTMLALSI